jgi:AraC-like DNA-binding protein
MRRQYRQGNLEIGPGQVWLCGMWEPHGFQLLETPCECVVLVAWPPLLASLRFAEAPQISWLAPFTVPPRQRPQALPAARAKILRVGQELKRVLLEKPAAQPLWLRHLFLETLLLLYEQGNFPQSRPAIAAADDFTRLNPALEKAFESRHLLTTAQAARICGLNRQTFRRLFVQWMGLRFPEFCLRYRVNAAANQLAHTDLPIKSIARQWGFTDASHFQRCFQKYYHCPPGEYRRHAKP